MTGASRSRHGIDRQEWSTRAHEFCARGERLPHARLTADVVRKIRVNQEGWPRWKWAECLGCHVRTIDKVATYETWRHVE